MIAPLAWPLAASAQSAEAESLFEEGIRLMTAGKLVQACEAFEASNRIEPRAGTLIRLGECRHKNRQLASAWSAYKDALTRAKDPEKKQFAIERVAELEPELSHLKIDVSAVAHVADLQLTRNGHPVDPVEWNHAVPVDGGTYQLVARAPGRRDWTATIEVPDASGKVEVTVPELQQLPPIESEPDVDRVAREPSPWTPRRKLAIATGALAIGGGIAGGVLGELARDKQHDAEALCMPNVPCVDGARAQSLLSTARTRALEANIAFGVAGAAAIATAVLWFTGAPGTADVAIVPAISPSGAALAVGGRF